MARRLTLRRQDGVVLPELIITMALGVTLMLAVMMTFDAVVRQSNDSAKRNDTAEQARRALDIEARQLRNLARRDRNQPVIGTVLPDDFTFQTSDPTRTWVRYCLDTSLGASRGRVWQQTQSSASPGPVNACPATTGWGRTSLVSDNVVNRIGGRDAPLFTYRCSGGGTTCTASSSTWSQIAGVDAQIYVDTTPTKPPAELQVTSGVYLRNQNQTPNAVISTPAEIVAGQARTIKLNASGSSDFEGRTLVMYWFNGTMPTAIDCANPKPAVSGTTTTMWGGTYLGEGVVLQRTFPASGTQRIGLVACDPGDLYDLDVKDMTIP